MKRECKAHLAIVLCFALIGVQVPAPARVPSSPVGGHLHGSAFVTNPVSTVSVFRNGIQTPYAPKDLAHRGQESLALNSRTMLPEKQLIQAQPATQSQPGGLLGQSSTLLADGRLLLLGGESEEGPVTTSSIKDPSSGQTMQLSNGLLSARAYHTATVLPDGTVLIWGGIGEGGNVLGTAESFDPTTLSFNALPATGLAPRAHHTATLLTDGTLFVVGGIAANSETSGAAQLWNFQTNTATYLPRGLVIPRRDHTASLQPDGTVLLWRGIQGNGIPVPDGEVFDPATSSFRIETRLPTGMEGKRPQLQATIPGDKNQNVSVNPLISIRFSEPLRIQTVGANTIKLDGPQGPLISKVVPAEGGMLAFITPAGSLVPDTTYTANLSGLADSSGASLQDTLFSFTTAGTPPNTVGSGLLGGTNAGSWSGDPQDSPWRKLSPLEAPPGVTAISGQVLLLGGHPLAKVTLRIGNNEVQTDGTGRFLLRNVSGGHLVMVIDGRSANTKTVRYCVFKDGVDVKTGQTNILNYTIWMDMLDVAHEVSIPIPTIGETVVTTPLMPGLEFHMPAGTKIIDIDGHVVNKVSITPIPISQPPFPLPAGVSTPFFFTIQPGGGRILVSKKGGGPDGGWLVYPNSFHEPVGSRFDLWNYEADSEGWYIYGHGGVSAPGSEVVPDPGVVIYELTGAMIASSGFGASSGPSGGGPSAGEPVDLGTGLFVYDKTDLYSADMIPIQLTRTYRPNDGASRAFGVGTSDDYDIFLVGSNYTYIELVMPHGQRIHYPRISTGTGNTDAVFQSNSTPGLFFASTIAWNGSGWSLTRRDGIIYTFHDGFNASTARQGALLSITDRNGNTLSVTRDSNFNATKISSPNGRWVQLTYDASYRITQAQDNIGRTVQYSYDSGGRLNKVIDVNGGTWLYNYDSNNNMTSLVDPRNITYLQNQYDSQNRVIKQTLADGVSTYQFAYNPGCVSNCSVITETDVTDPNGNIEKVNFNSPFIFSNGFSTGGTGSTITYAAGTSLAQTFNYQYQSGTNLLQSVTDPLNRTTSYAYDPLGNMTSVTQLSGTSNAVTTSIGYEAKFSQVTSISDPLNHATSFSYDAHGNLIAATDPLDNNSSFAYNTAGQVVSVIDPLLETTNLTYSGGDLASVTDPLGRTVGFFTDSAGRLVSRTDPLSGNTKYGYNAMNQIAQFTDPMGGITSFSHDPNGNLLSVTDPRNLQNPTIYTYDNNDRLATRKDPLGNQASYLYDGNGNLTQYTDRRGKVSTYTYDSLNRRTFSGFGKSGSSYESTVSYSFDADNRLTQAVDSVTGTITPTFDNLNRLTSMASPQGTVGYTYDAAGRRTSMTEGNQSAVNYSYDNANRLTQITQGTSTSVSFTYDAANRRTSLTLPNGVTMSYNYDSGSQLAGINYTLNSNLLGNLSYDYDMVGRRTSMGGTSAQTELPLAMSSAAYNVDNQLTQWGSKSLSYDANGNMTSDGTNSFVWNARNQLSSMNSNFVSFQYDPFGRRVGKTVAGISTGYLYDGANIAQEISGGSPIANLVTGGIDEVFTRTDSSGTANFLTDGLGSTLALTNASGSSLAQYAYEPFGNTTVTSGSSTNEFEYTGRENDGTGLYFNRARYYSPTLQRFISEDPIGFGGGDVNLYAYVSNGPIGSKDPFGMARDCFASWCQRVPRNPLPGRKAPSGAGAAPTNPGGTPEPTEPNPAVTVVADAVGVAGSVVGGKAGKVLGPASTIISVANDPSPENIGINALGLIPGLDVPIAFGSAAWDGSKFVTNQVLAPIFNAAPTQNINVDVGNGNLLTIPNPALDVSY